jgi:hypothetical protein
LANPFYVFLGLFTGIFPIAFAAGIYVIRTWPFDPPTEFEKRRIRMAKDLKKLMDSFKQSSSYKKSMMESEPQRSFEDNKED